MLSLSLFHAVVAVVDVHLCFGCGLGFLSCHCCRCLFFYLSHTVVAVVVHVWLMLLFHVGVVSNRTTRKAEPSGCHLFWCSVLLGAAVSRRGEYSP